jgi:hypothetical protein
MTYDTRPQAQITDSQALPTTSEQRHCANASSSEDSPVRGDVVRAYITPMQRAQFTQEILIRSHQTLYWVKC